MTKYIEAAETIFSDPIGALISGNRRLEAADESAFAREWLLRALIVELNRYSMEDAYIDVRMPAFRNAAAALERLLENDDWISPALVKYLVAFREAARLPRLAYRRETRVVGSNGSSFSISVRKAVADLDFRISNTGADFLPILEESLGAPAECKGVFEAFTARLNLLKSEVGVSHLCFIEKEMGPVGAISLFSSLVLSTDLPASIYRETHWASDLAIAGGRPRPGDRVAIVYDLAVTGVGIAGAADTVRDVTGADTVAAVVLCGYGDHYSTICSPKGQKIRLEALDWHEETHGPVFEYQPSRGEHETRSVGFESRTEPGEPLMDKNRRAKTNIPAGSYDRQSLPDISEKARQIVERVRESVQAKAAADKETSGRTDSAVRLSDRGKAIRLKK